MSLNENGAFPQASSQKFDIRKIITTYTSQWKWFVLSLVLFLGGAYLYLRYQVPQYAASSTIMILADQEDSSADKVFKDLSLANEADAAAIEDEILVFSSRNVLRNVVEALNLHRQFFTKGLVLESELYGTPPFEVNFVESDSLYGTINLEFYVEVHSKDQFTFKLDEDDEGVQKSFGDFIETPVGNLVITMPEGKDPSSLIDRSIRVQFTPITQVVESLRNRISVYPSQSSTKILNIYLEDPIYAKAKDIINTLIQEYDKYKAETKNRKSEGIARLIDSRIDIIARDLVGVDDSIVSFKTSNKVTNVSSQASQFMTLSFQNEQEIQNIKTQLKLLNYTKELLATGSNDFKMLPSNLEDPTMSALTSQYNQLLAQRQNYLKSAGEKNSVVMQLTEQLISIKNNLAQNINAKTRSLKIQLNSLENQYMSVNSKISSVPGQENKLRSIERGRGIKESVYLYLLQKKEEAIISQTATSSSVKIIDDAYSLGVVSPNKKMTYMAALFLGLLIPFGVIYVRDLLDNKIHNREDLAEAVSDITILGEIPSVKNASGTYIKRNDRSVLSESYRIIRTNFDFVKRARNVKDYDNVVFVTSTINSEGKSFFSANFALTLANTNKRVLLLGADIRNPNVDIVKEQIKSKAVIGLTEYLNDDSVKVDDIINSYDLDGNKIDMIIAGKIPPNPAELLMSDRLKPLFDQVSADYDYVIVDTAPSMLVTDTLLISQYAGHTVYLTRGGYTEKSLLNFAKELHHKNKLNGMMLVVNDVDQDNFGYGARYGYYATEKKGFFRKLFSKAS